VPRKHYQPDHALQQTGHAKGDSLEFNALSRVSRLLSFSVRRRTGERLALGEEGQAVFAAGLARS